MKKIGFVPEVILLMFCCINLMIMHFYIVIEYPFATGLDLDYYVDNILGICFDIIIVYSLCRAVFLKRLKNALALCFVITWLWSFSNVMYSRFFFQYLSLSAIKQGHAITDGLIIQCIKANFHLFDLYYPLAIFLFIFVLSRFQVKPIRFSVYKVFVGVCFVILFDLFTHLTCCVINPNFRYLSYFCNRVYGNHIVGDVILYNPKMSHFLRGEMRTIIDELVLEFHGNIELSTQQICEIKELTTDSKNSFSNKSQIPSSANLIFILVESYMSFTSDMIVDGKEVTPFLNSLKKDSMVYYNGNLHNNVTLGCSSDGQFIYMTGLLPLRSVITLSKARNVVLPGLPKALGRTSRMIIPTITSIWNQDEMCRQYGFDELFARSDYNKVSDSNLSDEQVFQLALQKDKVSSQPFLSVVLTISMHQPYNKQIDNSFIVKNPLFTTELSSYLNACHYTDSQIKKYIQGLKEIGLYDNSVIVIAADHPVFSADFGDVPSSKLPLYIIAAGLPKSMWHGDCNQLDVYTTLLDIFGYKGTWFGLGHSLLSPNYRNSVTDRAWNSSECILMSDFFNE